MTKSETIGKPIFRPSMIETINTWRHVQIVPFEMIEDIIGGGDGDWESATFGLAITPDGVTVQAPKIGANEWYHAYVGTHSDYGRIALLHSVRGPGGGSRERPVFMFYSGYLEGAA
jgi:hypothetical protein